MYNFDPAINYGPNDAGVSAFSILIGVLVILAGSWLFGSLYAFVMNFFKSKKNGNEL